MCGLSTFKINKKNTQYLSQFYPSIIILYELKTNYLNLGDCISIDHYKSTVRGCLTHTKGKESETEQFQGGTIAVDHASSKIYIFHQVSLCARETLQAKQVWESNLLQYGFQVKTYHSDNGVLHSAKFQADLQRKNQKIDFSGTGAHHQSDVAKYAIRTVVEWARIMILHTALRWPEKADLKL